MWGKLKILNIYLISLAITGKDEAETMWFSVKLVVEEANGIKPQ